MVIFYPAITIIILHQTSKQ